MPRTPSTTPPKRHDPRTSATSRPSTKPVVGAAAKAAPATTERKEETKKEARDAEKMPAREPVRMRRAKAWNVEVENAYRFQCAGWRSAVRVSASRGAVHAIDARRPAQEEYAQGEYGDEISWFSDSGLVEKVQNRQGLFMYFKRSVAASAALRLRWSPRRRGAWLGLAVAVREKRVRHAGTASASTSTCRASRSSSTRTTAATSR